jgi:hypothetical protein
MASQLQFTLRYTLVITFIYAALLGFTTGMRLPVLQVVVAFCVITLFIVLDTVSVRLDQSTNTFTCKVALMVAFYSTACATAS